jgi:DNA-directed RNA polymerase subunit E'/Rpb7
MHLLGTACGKVIDEQPWIHMDIATKFVVFRPMKDQIVKGKIIQVSRPYTYTLI